MSTATTSAAVSQPQRTYRPVSPESLKPNAHPYAIRTTTLSRSNSATSQKQDNLTRHHYIPPPPSPSPRKPGTAEGTNLKRMEGRSGHRYSKSLSSSELPLPLPLPPTPTSLDEGDTGGYRFPRTTSPTKESPDAKLPAKDIHRTRRAETLPSYETAPFPPTNISSPSSRPLPTPPPVSPTQQPPDLPSNPKLWSPSQVATYLGTALRVRSIDDESAQELPPRVVQDIADLVRKEKVTGKIFLRLSEADLEEMHINPLWRTALLSVSRSLRRNILAGRIWGFGSGPSPPSSPEATSTKSRFIRHPHRTSQPPSPPSSIEEEDEKETTPNDKPRQSKFRQSRLGVGLGVDVNDWESRSNPTSPSPSGRSRFLPQPSSPTKSDMSANSADEDVYLSSSSSTSSLQRGRRIDGRYSNGRVRGMVESFERSRSGSISEGEELRSDDQSVSSNASGRSSIIKSRPLPAVPTPPASTLRQEEEKKPLPVTPSVLVSDEDIDKEMEEYLDSLPADEMPAFLGSLRNKSKLPSLSNPGSLSGKSRMKGSLRVKPASMRVKDGKGSTRGGDNPNFASVRASRLFGSQRKGLVGMFAENSIPDDANVASPSTISTAAIPEHAASPPIVAPVAVHPVGSVRIRHSTGEVEPTIEELLRSSAWEEADSLYGEGVGLGETVKRIPVTSENQTSTPASTRELPQIPVAKPHPKVYGVHAWEEEGGDASSNGEAGVGRATMKRALPPHPSSGNGTRTASMALANAGTKLPVKEAAVSTDAEHTSVQNIAQGSINEAEVTELQSAIASNRMLLDTFRQRLEDIEAKVTQMEKQIAHRASVSSQKSKGSQSSSTTTSSVAKSASTSWLDFARILSDPRGALADALVGNSSRGDPTSMKGIPSYVILVSLGMCAAVLRVVLKKATSGVAGRR